MKTMMTCAALAAISGDATAAAIVEDRVWSEDYTVTTATPRLAISNIWGNVRVRPGATGRISVTVDERRSAPNRELFERSLEAFRLDVSADLNGVSMIVGGEARNWRMLDPCPGCRVDYQFEVLVPPGAEINVETVTDGRIDVAGIDGRVSASNVNGPISVSGLRDCESMDSVNGDVELEFPLTPGNDCRIKTVNGDITLAMPDGAGLDMALNLFNGRVVSQMQVDALALPARVERTQLDGHNRYRIQQPAGLRVGAGGPTFSISSLNGELRILRNQ